MGGSMNQVKIECKICKELLEAGAIKLRERKCDNNLIEVYYICPKCKHKYFVCYHNAKTKRLQKAIKRKADTGKILKTENMKIRLKNELDRINGR